MDFHALDRVARLQLDLERDRLARECLCEQVRRRLLLDVAVGQRTSALVLLAREDRPLLVRRDALRVPMLCFDDRLARDDLRREYAYR